MLKTEKRGIDNFMKIKPNDSTVAEILTNKRYKIPNFQRDYSWDKKYYQEFLYDMINQLSFNEKVEGRDYFLGTMLFLNDEDTTELIVIDGQQRLTTITILFTAISRLLKDYDKGLSDATFQYIVFKDRLAKDQKVIYPPNSFPYFTKAIQKIEPDEDAIPKTDEEDLIKETYDYFQNSLSKEKISRTISSAFLGEIQFGKKELEKYQYVNVLIALRDQVLDSQLIYIETELREQANLIFEILNAKGKKLSAIDLIKNKVFENIGDTLDDEAEIQWKKMQSILQDGNIPILVFFRHYWSATIQKATAFNLYVKVNTHLRGKKSEKKTRTQSLLSELNRNAELYSYIVNPNNLDFWDNKKSYQEIVDTLLFTKSFNITQYRIAVLSLIRAKREDKITMKLFRNALVCIEEFSFIFFQLMSSRGSKVENLFSKFAVSLTNSQKTDAANVITKQLLDPLAELLPDLEGFTSYFIELKYTNTLDKDLTDYEAVRYFINKINVHNNPNSKYVDHNCSIEHILPDDKADEFTWNIGNLIPLESYLNEKLGNDNYDLKKSGYKDSKYEEVLSFLAEHQTWDGDQIAERAKKLAEYYYNEILSSSLKKNH